MATLYQGEQSISVLDGGFCRGKKKNNPENACLLSLFCMFVTQVSSGAASSDVGGVRLLCLFVCLFAFLLKWAKIIAH